jgi:hypothetical protein
MFHVGDIVHQSKLRRTLLRVEIDLEMLEKEGK